MGLLTDKWDDTVEYLGHRYRTNAAYDVVLAIQSLYKDDRLPDTDKVDLALKMLLSSPIPVRILSAEHKIGLLEAIFESQVSVPKKPSAGKGGRLVDFGLDGEYIYASFYQDYGIDLIEQQGRLHWKKFLALFSGLSEDTKIRQVMQIRGMDVPEPNPHNMDRVRKLMELKSYYALPVDGGGGQKGLNGLFSALEGLAR